MKRDVQLSTEARKVLEVMREIHEKNPNTRIKGIPKRTIGARAGSYLNNPLYELWEIDDAGFVRKIQRNMYILTKEGEQYARPYTRRFLNRFFNPLKKQKVKRQDAQIYAKTAEVSLDAIVGIIGTLKVRKLHKVFVVHGRDEPLRHSIFEFLISIGLNPVKLSGAIGLTGASSPYIGQILDSAFDDAQAIVVLFTGDDKVRLRDKYWQSHEEPHEKKYKYQPRPNVIFEAGMAFARQPNRTILVQIGDVKPIFSDLQGRHSLKLDNSTEKRQDFINKLQAAGCQVDTSANKWQKAGDFTLSD